MTLKAIVFGATGPIGSVLVEIISQEHPDWEILAVSRSPTATTSRLASLDLKNVKMVQGDPMDKENVLELTKPCDMIFCCIGFPEYERKYWAKHWPIVIENLLQATGANKKLIFCDNLYAYGPGRDISPHHDTVEPSNKSKPAIRAQLRQTIQTHMEKYPGTVVVVGGSDFFGPFVTGTSFLGDTLTGKIVQGQNPLAVGSASVIHDFCYAPDLSRALATVAVRPTAYDRFWICPHSVHNKSIQEIANDIASKATGGQTKIVKVSVINKWMVYLLSPFMGFMAEMKEMLPFWTMDYTVVDSDFITEMGIEATPYDEALQAYVDFYKSQEKA